jgi:hypothetical protein
MNTFIILMETNTTSKNPLDFRLSCHNIRYIIRERHTKSDTYWPHQHDCLLQQLYTFLCVHCEYFYYVYFVYFPHEGSSLPFLNKILLIIYAAQGPIPQKTIVTRRKSVKFHPQEQIKEATTSHKELFKSCLSLCTKKTYISILQYMLLHWTYIPATNNGNRRFSPFSTQVTNFNMWQTRKTVASFY